MDKEQAVITITGAGCMFIGGLLFRLCFAGMVMGIEKGDWVLVTVGFIGSLVWAGCLLFGAGLLWWVSREWVKEKGEK
mgnify:CR=1 FL=1